MTQKIVFKNKDGSIGIITPSAEVLAKYTLTQIAQKDTPTGLPYVIIDEANLPDSRTFRNAWELAEDTVFDGVGSESNEFPEEIEVAND